MISQAHACVRLQILTLCIDFSGILFDSLQMERIFSISPALSCWLNYKPFSTSRTSKLRMSLSLESFQTQNCSTDQLAQLQFVLL